MLAELEMQPLSLRLPVWISGTMAAVSLFKNMVESQRGRALAARNQPARMTFTQMRMARSLMVTAARQTTATRWTQLQAPQAPQAPRAPQAPQALPQAPQVPRALPQALQAPS